MTDGCFYETVTDAESFLSDNYSGTFVPTVAAQSPWNPEHQHAGPVAALMLRAVEQLELPIAAPLSARMSLDLFAPVPLSSVAVTSTVVKSGRSAALLQSELVVPGSDRVIARMLVWRLRQTAQDPLPHLSPEVSPPPGGTKVEASSAWAGGFVEAMDWWLVSGDLSDPGPATVWASPRVDLVDDEPARGVPLLALIADEANGISAELDPREHTFVNTDLSLHVDREPGGDRLWMSGQTWLGGRGVGYSSAQLGDEAGPVAMANQTLFIADAPQP